MTPSTTSTSAAGLTPAASTAAAEAGADPSAAAFAEAAAAFGRAARAAGELERTYDLAGRVVRLRFAGGSLERRLSPALAHRRAPSADGRTPELTVCLWDSASTGVAMPELPWREPRAGAPALSLGAADRACRAALQPLAPGVAATSMLDARSATGIYHVADAATLPAFETSASLRTILHWWLSARGVYLVHAAAVGTSRAGALLVGRGGSGKSTTALAAACGDAGLLFAGDDYVALDVSATPIAHSLYGTAKLDPRLLAHFPAIDAQAVDRGETPGEKAVVLVSRTLRERMAATLPVSAVLVPVVTGRSATTVRPTSRADALAALAPTTLLQLPGAGQRELIALAGVLGRVPCFRLELGTDFARIPHVIAELLARECSAQPAAGGPS